MIICSYCFKSVSYVCDLTNQYFFHLLVNLCYRILCGYHIQFDTLIKFSDSELEQSCALWNAPVQESLQLLTILRLQHFLIAFSLRSKIRFFKATKRELSKSLVQKGNLRQILYLIMSLQFSLIEALSVWISHDQMTLLKKLPDTKIRSL